MNINLLFGVEFLFSSQKSAMKIGDSNHAYQSCRLSTKIDLPLISPYASIYDSPKIDVDGITN